MNRIQNTRRILSSGIINQVLNLVFPFINRTVIIYLLGSEFAGLSGLFSSILQVLSLADFGFSMVIVAYLYEPIAKNDSGSINQILSWIRKIYHWVGVVILGLGVFTTPFLTLFIHGNYPESINIYILYLIYLLNSGISYFLFAYKEVLLIADQRKDIVNNLHSVVKIAVNILQFLALFLFRNYYLYVVLLVIGTVSTNLLVNRAVQKRYPYLTITTGKNDLSSDTKKELVGLMINRLSNVSRNAFDSLIISATLGLVATAMYGNYYMIYNAVFGFTGIISGSMQASVGNSIVVKTEKENYENLLDFSLLYSWIIGWCSVTMACLYQPFMKLWVGEELMLSNTDMILFAVYFYFINMNHMRNQYILGNAFWWKLKWAYLAEAICNLGLNIILGKVFGILIATILTIFFCNYLMCNAVLFKEYFTEQSIWSFYKQQFYYLLVAVIIGVPVFIVCEQFDSIIIRAFVCVIVPNVLFMFFYQPCGRWSSSMGIVKRFMKIKQGG